MGECNIQAAIQDLRVLYQHLTARIQFPLYKATNVQFTITMHSKQKYTYYLIHNPEPILVMLIDIAR